MISEINSTEIAQFIVQTGAHLDIGQEIAKFLIQTGAHLDMAKEIDKSLATQSQSQTDLKRVRGLLDEALPEVKKSLGIVDDRISLIRKGLTSNESLLPYLNHEFDRIEALATRIQEELKGG